MAANFLRKRALSFSDDEDTDALVYPPTPTKRNRIRDLVVDLTETVTSPSASPTLAGLDSQHTDRNEMVQGADRPTIHTALHDDHAVDNRSRESTPPSIATPLSTKISQLVTPPSTPTRRMTRQQPNISVQTDSAHKTDPIVGGGLDTPPCTPKSKVAGPQKPHVSSDVVDKVDPFTSNGLDTPPSTPKSKVAGPQRPRALTSVMGPVVNCGLDTSPSAPKSKDIRQQMPRTLIRSMSVSNADEQNASRHTSALTNAQNIGGLTPAVNKVTRSSSKENSVPSAKVKKSVRTKVDENSTENENTKAPGYSTPKRLQRTKSVMGTADTSSSSKCRGSSSCSSTTSLPSSSSSVGAPTHPMSVVLGYYQNAKTLFRRTAEPTRLVGRSTERDTIRQFCQDHIVTAKSGSLYISGQPGTGKTALLNEVLRDMEPKMKAASHEIKTLMVNCMMIKDPKLVYSKLLEEMGYMSESKDKDSAVKTLGSLVLASNKNKVMFVIILDEVDQLLTRDQEVLYKLFQWSFMEHSKLTLIGIANALDMTDRFLPRLKAKNCEPQLLHFNPYQVADIRAIIMDRLFSLENQRDQRSETDKPRVAPLIQRPAVELCARKVAAATGDLRKALDICRQTIEMVEMEVKKKERIDRLKQQQQHALTPLSASRLASLENRAAGGADPSGLCRRMSGSFGELSSNASFTAGSNNGSSSSVAVVTLQDAPKVTVEHMKKALASAFGSPMVQKLKELNVHQKIVLAVLVMKMQSGKMTDCEVGKVFDQYAITCRSSGRISGVNRGEYQDLINVLEAQGLITLSKAKEERLRKIGLVPRESEVLEAIRGQDMLQDIVVHAGLDMTKKD
ncbi:AAA ATPase [Haplosporangium sp. Z 767]|nr:AAA ATPase [Haplosporangium sp. Z 11]KAF9190404.1 AAA ATPase [Haplosporangium sp. Z 767]